MLAQPDWFSVVTGFAASVLGVLDLVEEHRSAPLWLRFVVGGLILCCVRVAVDGLFGFQCPPFGDAGGLCRPDDQGPLFAALLGVGWFYRLRVLKAGSRRGP
jgi:hypothetical protein